MCGRLFPSPAWPADTYRSRRARTPAASRAGQAVRNGGSGKSDEKSNVVPADIDDEVFRARRSYVFGVMDFVGADHSHIARTQPVRLAGDGQLHGSEPHEHH